MPNNVKLQPKLIVTAFLTFVLTSALFGLPCLAASYDFAHRHAGGSLEHFHNPSTIFSFIPIPTVFLKICLAACVCIILLWGSIVLRYLPNRATYIRGPPNYLSEDEDHDDD